MNTQDTAATTHEADLDAPVAKNDPNTVNLDEPIVRGGGKQVIASITFRRPSSGELRGLTLNALANLDVESLQKLIPRISSPMVTRKEAEDMDPADLLQCGGVIGGFLLPKREKANMALQTE